MRISDWSSDVCSSDLSSRTRISPPDLAVIARGHTIRAPKQRGPGEGGIARHAGADINGARRRRLGYGIEPAPHRQCPHLGRTGELQPVDEMEDTSEEIGRGTRRERVGQEVKTLAVD